MKFVDEAVITVEAGKGGNGTLSFRREKYVAKGGPDGGNGGNGGSIYLVADPKLNTLVDFRHKRIYRAENGCAGMGKDRIGKQGIDLTIAVPVGTLVYDNQTQELIADLNQAQGTVLVARGGERGLGNAHFKSSVNRAPRRTTPGQPGEKRELYLELKLLADVGLLGLPNAGKSSLIRAVSSAKPRVADYPFTTLYPNLGVVQVSPGRSFVIADIPGLIEGAASGAGLGIKFLKHLSRTRILLHLIDVAPIDGCDPVVSAQQVVKELEAFGGDLVEKPRWLVLNKIDLLPEDTRDKVLNEIIQKLAWQGPVFAISAKTREGTSRLCTELMVFIDQAT